MTIDRDDKNARHPLPGALRLSGRDLHDARLLVRDVIVCLADEWTATGVAGGWFAAFDRAARLQESLGTADATLEPAPPTLPPELAEMLVEFAADELRRARRRLAQGLDSTHERITAEEREARAERVLTAIAQLET
ncbi:MAG: hypothetical protein HYX33_02860 [Actinobacteria bacterium]|nr:hypothetical protein [Actinomycetota bacterium]